MLRAPGPPMTAYRRLSCPVRGCGEALAPQGRTLRCPRAHAFDFSRRGTLHLLQPQERRSRQPGDDPAIVAARERLAQAGLDQALRAALLERVAGLGLGQGAGVLDVGCGVGCVLATLRSAGAAPGAELYGVDLSAAAVATAARREPQALWIVANADRRLPFLDGSLDLVLSIKAPKHPDEFARVLAPGGTLLLALPAVDDLLELRRATAGGGLARDPAQRAREAFVGRFELLEEGAVRERVSLLPEVARDLLRVSYRAARRGERARAEALPETSVTLAATLLTMRRRDAPGVHEGPRAPEAPEMGGEPGESAQADLSG